MSTPPETTDASDATESAVPGSGAPAPETLVAHFGLHTDEVWPEPMVVPIVQSAAAQHGSIFSVYGRRAQPNRQILESALGRLESAAHAVAFPSGMAAIFAALEAADRDRVVLPMNVYGGVYELVSRRPSRHRIGYDLIDYADPAALDDALGSGPGVLWLECPSNPLLDVYDIAEIAARAHDADALVVVDNTLATPLVQQPLKWGADLVVNSISKYIGGHSDLIGGVVTTNDDHLGESLTYYQASAGIIPSPMDCWLAARGIRTLSVRLRCQEANAAAFADAMAAHPGVQRVYYPGSSERARTLYERGQLSGYGAVVSLDLAEGVSTETFLDALKLVRPATSLGGLETTVSHPFSMSHRLLVADGVCTLPASLFRVSLGIENVDDIVGDVARALRIASNAN